MPNDLTLRILENEKTSEPTTQKANFGSYSTYCIIVIPGIIVLLLYQALPWFLANEYYSKFYGFNITSRWLKTLQKNDGGSSPLIDKKNKNNVF